jgi:hypothetical protein
MTAAGTYAGELRRQPDGTYAGAMRDGLGWTLILRASVREDSRGKFFALQAVTGQPPAELRIFPEDHDATQWPALPAEVTP